MDKHVWFVDEIKLYELFSLVHVFRDEGCVAKEETDTDDGENDVDARAQPCGLFECEFLSFEGSILVRRPRYLNAL